MKQAQVERTNIWNKQQQQQQHDNEKRQQRLIIDIALPFLQAAASSSPTSVQSACLGLLCMLFTSAETEIQAKQTSQHSNNSKSNKQQPSQW